jgi:hypothetical protein
MRARGMIEIGTVLAMVALNSGQAAAVSMQVGDVIDYRSTGKFFAKLEVNLKLMGDELEGAKRIRLLVTKAVDETGRNLIQEENQNKFSEIDNNNPNPTQNQVTVQLKNPSRKAATVQEISGEIELFNPARDPASTVTITNITGRPKFTLSAPSLTAAQIEMTVLSKEQYDKEAKAAEEKNSGMPGSEQMSEEMGKAFAGLFGFGLAGSKNSVIIRVKDPQSKLAKVEFLDASSKDITESRMTVNDVSSYDFSKPLPKSAQLRVYVATTKSLSKTPFTFRDLALP